MRLDVKLITKSVKTNSISTNLMYRKVRSVIRADSEKRNRLKHLHCAVKSINNVTCVDDSLAP